ncbi:helix-turn-helix domain-containing protein [Paenibacillaceae bacterium WGS1546]|uniref:helix-turn-helix domain-containing protein n=1 Tax=Cohnella sp. WGS1546 TaxID=3366810 RepID=UPI00372D75EC
MNILHDFGLRVRELRSRANITQEQLAARANLSRVYISDIERGKRNVTLQNIENIAAAFRVSIEYIFSAERFSTIPAFQTQETPPFTERFKWHLDPDRRLLSFTIEGLLSTKQEVKHVESTIIGVCSAYPEGLDILVDHRSMLSADGQPAVYGIDVTEAAITFQQQLNLYSNKTIVLTNSQYMANQFDHVKLESGINSTHLFAPKDKDLIEQAFSILDINGNQLVKPLG